MWKRVKKGSHGEIVNISSSDQPWYKATERPVYDSMDGVKYTVEYLRKENAEAAEKANLRGSSVEPWEFRDYFETDSLGLFIKQIVMRLLSPDIEDIWPYMEVGDREICAEIPSDTAFIVREIVSSELNKKNRLLSEKVEALENELKIYQAFVAKYNAYETLYNFRKELEAR